MTHHEIDRRTFLRLSGGAALAGAAGALAAACTSEPTTSPSSPVRTSATGRPSGEPSASSSESESPSASPSEAEAGPPTEADWAALRTTLRGPLVRPSDPGYAVARELFEPRFDSARPQAIAFCEAESDVQRCVDFARRHGVVPTPRCGGHSYAGYSTGSGLVIDVGRMNQVTVGNGVVTVGAGARLIDLYAAIGPRGLAVPGGTCPSVGISGLALGGGQGVVGRALGLTCDAMQSLRVVAASGEVRACDPTTNGDLYWASRGGGGGNFGIATRFVFRTTPVGSVTMFSLHWPWAAAADVMGAWQAWGPGAPDALWSDCHLLARAGNPPGPLSASVNGVFIGSASGVAPLLSGLRSLVGSQPDHTYISTKSYGDAMVAEAGCSGMTIAQCHLPNANPAGLLQRQSALARSDFFDAAIPDAAVSSAIQAIVERQNDPALGTTGGVLFDAFGGAINRVAPGATAFVHRSQRFLAQYFANLPTPASPSTVNRNQTWLNSLYGRLHPSASGQAYQNYIDPSLQDWPQAYYASNLPRLQQVKQRYDPDQLFRFPQGITPG
jgi:FAD/FMN-containing dehydrogenase